MERYLLAIIIFDGTRVNIVQTETTMVRSVFPPKESRDADEASTSSNESMGAHASHDDDDEDTEDESSSDEENDPWNTLINDAVSKVWDQYKEILQELLMESHDESKEKEEAFAQILPAFRIELGDAHMDNLTWMTVIWKFSKASVKLSK